MVCPWGTHGATSMVSVGCPQAAPQCPRPTVSPGGALTGVMTVRSGRWLPPAQGWLLRSTSPSRRSSPSLRICDGSGFWGGLSPTGVMEGARGGVGYEAPPHLELDGLLHGAQVHGDVGGVGHQPPVRPEKGAGEVEALLDVGGDGRALQDPAHLLCGGTEGPGGP